MQDGTEYRETKPLWEQGDRKFPKYRGTNPGARIRLKDGTLKYSGGL